MQRGHVWQRTLRALSWVFGFLLPMRFLSDCMAALGATVLDLMTSEISRLSAISSLYVLSLARLRHHCNMRRPYRLLLVAFSICSSSAVLAEDDHQLIMLGRLCVTKKGLGDKGENGASLLQRRGDAGELGSDGDAGTDRLRWMEVLELQLRARLWGCVRSSAAGASAPLTTSAVASRRRRHQPPEQWLFRCCTTIHPQPRSCTLYL